MFKIHLLPKKLGFLDLFVDSAQNAVQAAQAFQSLVYDYEDIVQKAGQITELEHAGDAITHKIIAQLHRTFITPFDREDIAALAGSLDDVTDLIEAAADTMVLYKVEQPGDKAKAIVDAIVRSTIEVEAAVRQLQQKAGSKRILEICVEINRLENVADQAFRAARGDLFDNSTDFCKIMKWHEIYQLMEEATDRCEDVSNILEGIVLKNA